MKLFGYYFGETELARKISPSVDGVGFVWVPQDRTTMFRKLPFKERGVIENPRRCIFEVEGLRRSRSFVNSGRQNLVQTTRNNLMKYIFDEPQFSGPSPYRKLEVKQHEYRQTASRLPDDVCRCHDDVCILREHCLRFLQRQSGGVNVRHAATLREENAITCERQIPV
jgi:hypothetical protein